MALTPSTMPGLSTPAASFALPDTNGKLVTLDNFDAAAALLVVFWCNHCPYVQHIRAGFTRFVDEYQPRGLAVVAINANDVSTHPDDDPAQMRIEARKHGYSFPYLFDETQQTALAYRAACTPDFFLYDSSRKLAYRGQFDASRPGNDVPVTGADLRRAVDALLNGTPVSPDQRPSIGCNIKWKPGNEPAQQHE